MARIHIVREDGRVYSVFRIRPTRSWGDQLSRKLSDIINDIQEVLEEEERNP